MTRLLEGVKKLYTGNDALNRQICLFSICGIVGLIEGIFSIATQSSNSVGIFQSLLLCGIICIIEFYFIGFEVLYLQKRELPDFNLKPLKISCNKFMLVVAVISMILAIFPILFPKHSYSFLCLGILFAIPLTMLQAGFSYNLDNSDIFKLFNIFKIKDYFLLLLKRIWVVVFSYIVTLTLIFIIFFICGFAIAIYFKGDVSTIGLLISSQQITIAKFSNFIFLILLNYILLLGTLSWDYELITTFESEEE